MIFVGFCGYLVVKWQQTQFVGFSGEFLAVSGEIFVVLYGYFMVTGHSQSLWRLCGEFIDVCGEANLHKSRLW